MSSWRTSHGGADLATVGARGSVSSSWALGQGLLGRVFVYGLYLGENRGGCGLSRANGDHTIAVLRRLRAEAPDRQVIVLWDGAPYHRAMSLSKRGGFAQGGIDPAEHGEHDGDGFSGGLSGEPRGEGHAGFSFMQDEHGPRALADDEVASQ